MSWAIANTSSRIVNLAILVMMTFLGNGGISVQTTFKILVWMGTLEMTLFTFTPFAFMFGKEMLASLHRIEVGCTSGTLCFIYIISLYQRLKWLKMDFEGFEVLL